MAKEDSFGKRAAEEAARRNNKNKKIDNTPRNTGMYVGAGDVPGPSATYSSSEVYPNLQAAPRKTAQKIIGETPSSEYINLVSPDEETNIRNRAAAAAAAAASGSGGFTVNYGNMLNALKRLAAMQQNQINTSAGSLSALLASQSNPYMGMEVTRTAPDQGLQQLLQSQGVDTSPLSQFASALNAQNTGQADAYRNLVGQMSGMYDASRLGQQQDVEANRIDMLNALQGNVLGTGTALIGKKNVDRNAIVNMLLSAMNNRRA